MKALEQTLRWIVIGGIFVLPTVAIIVANGLFFPFITGKNFTFRIVIEIIAGAWIALALVVPMYRPRRSWILAAFGIFILVMAVADAQGVYPFKSFWSNYERMDGWITIAHAFAFLVVAVSVLNTEDLWRRLFQWSLGVSVFLSLWGLLQVAGLAALGQGGAGGLGARVDATFGNPIYMAVYMLFHIFIAALLWYQTRAVRGTGKRTAASILYGSVIVLDTLALLFSGTRGATLGLIGGALLALLLFAFSSQASKRLRQVTIAVFAGVLILGTGLFVARDSAFVQRIVFLNRLSSISLSDDTTVARFLNMGMAWQGVKERPLLGWGQENYAIVFDKYYDPRMYAQEQWFDRVHNIIFDWWVAGGTLGLLSYLSIFAAVLWALWRKGIFIAAERSILTGLLAGYFVHNLTVFDNVTSYILFVMLLGYIIYRHSAALQAPRIFDREILPGGALWITTAAMAIVVCGGVWWINAQALAANYAIIAAITPQNDLNKNLAFFQQAIAYGTYGTQEAREQLSQAAMQVAGAGSNVPDSLKTQFVSTAAHELDLQAQMSPLDARFPLFAGVVLDASGDYNNAAVEVGRAHELSPHKQSILYELARNAQQRGDVSSAVRYFAEAFNLYPENLDARLYYVSALIQTGQNTRADAILAPVIPTGQAANQRITQAYVSRQEYSKLVPIWQAYVKVNPSDAQGYFTLAAIYYSAHDIPHAIATLQQAGVAVPSAKAQADLFIQQIRDGTIKLQ